MKEQFYKQLKADSWKQGDQLLLALSGGIDSMAMANLAKLCQINFAIAHVNYQLRGEDSDGDEAFLREWASENQVGFHLLKVDTKKMLGQSPASLQMLARNIRYDWFKELIDKKDYDFVATAHHLDDSLETLFLNLDRGTGIRGLKGIASRDMVLRPMQQFSREDIEAFMQENQFAFREDSSNQKEDYQRNWFRHQLIKSWKGKNPALMKTMAQNFSNFRAALEVYESAIEQDLQSIRKEIKQGRIAIASLIKLKHKTESSRVFLSELGFNHTQVNEINEAIDQASVGAEWYSPDYRIILDRAYLFLQERRNKEDDGAYSIFNFQSSIKKPIKIAFSLHDPKDYAPSEDAKTEFINWDKLKFPLQLRKWRAGDKMKPLGMRGNKKISDLLNEAKVSKLEKEQSWVLCSGDEIVCLLGHRMSDKFKIDDQCTQVFRVQLLD